MAKADNLYISKYNDIYGILLTKHQSEMIRLYYDCDISLFEIAEQFNITRQAVRDSIKRAETLLLEFEEKLKLTQKSVEMKNQLSNIIELMNLGDTESVLQILIKLKDVLEGDNGGI